MFKITDHKGFQITFQNGWTVSVQFGPRNYCEGYPGDLKKDYNKPEEVYFWAKPDAEIAAWKEYDKEWYRFPNSDTVQGHQTPEQVLEFMNTISKLT